MFYNMNFMITQYIERRIEMIDIDTTNKIYNYLIDNIIIENIEGVILNHSETSLLCTKIIIPDNFNETVNLYPIKEWERVMQFNNHNIKICLGDDFWGIRYYGDPYSYYIVIEIINDDQSLCTDTIE